MLDAPTSVVVRTRRRSAAWSVALACSLLAGPSAGAVLAADPIPSPDPSAGVSTTADLTPAPTPSPSPAPTAPPLAAVPTPAPIVALSLLRSGDYVRQFTSTQCVGASLQIMRNMVYAVDSHSSLVQRVLWLRARRTSLYLADGGADPFGWVTATTISGHGRYALVGASTLQGALRIAARGMALTRRPAGIVVWSGHHAWVVTGIDTTADPATTEDFDVVAVRIADPLYPYYRVWHRIIYRPGTRLSVATLARNYNRYHDPRLDPRIEGRFVVIVPWRSTDPLPPGAMAPPYAALPTPAPTPAPSVTPAPAAPSTSDPAATPPAVPTTVSGPSPTPASTPDPTPPAAPTPGPTPAPTIGPLPAPSESPVASPST